MATLTFATVGYAPPTQSRARIYLYQGSVCPQQLSFGYVHGESPNKGTMQYNDDMVPSMGKKITVKCGYHTYLGLVTMNNKEFSASSGNNRTISFVDMRDRLHDCIHYAQYNMTDDDKFRIYHILPGDDWKNQIRRYCNSRMTVKKTKKFNQDIKKLETVDQWTTEQMPPFSAKTLLNNLGITYNFKITATEAAMKRLEQSYPDNLDFNGGVKVISCIQRIVEPLNLQFTAYGDLTIHITMKGIAENEFDKKLLAGTIELCSLPGYVSATLGAELNERGRRVNIVGGRNRYEGWYPCYPAWNLNVTYNMCINGLYLSSLLLKNNAVPQQKMNALGNDFATLGIVYDGINADFMSIRQYIEEVCFRVYEVDFEETLVRSGDNKFSNKNRPNFRWDTKEKSGDYYTQVDGEKWYHVKDSLYPLSSGLYSDIKNQYKIVATNRDFQKKGVLQGNILEGFFEEIDDAASVDAIEVFKPSQNDSFQDVQYKVRVKFNKNMFKSIPNPDNPGTYKFIPDTPYIYLCLEKEVYTFDVGDDYSSPRVRPIVIAQSDLRKNFDPELKEDMKPYAGYDVRAMYLSDSTEVEFTTEQLARAIAEGTLLHEFISANGSIVFRRSCGFAPTGMIESVNVTFGATTGIQESINFTNATNNNLIPVYRDTNVVKAAGNKMMGGTTDREGARGKNPNDPLIKQALQHMKDARFVKPVPGKPDFNNAAANMGPIQQQEAFGGLRNTMVAQLDMEKATDEKFVKGEVIILRDVTT